MNKNKLNLFFVILLFIFISMNVIYANDKYNCTSADENITHDISGNNTLNNTDNEKNIRNLENIENTNINETEKEFSQTIDFSKDNSKNNLTFHQLTNITNFTKIDEKNITIYILNENITLTSNKYEITTFHKNTIHLQSTSYKSLSEKSQKNGRYYKVKIIHVKKRPLKAHKEFRVMKNRKVQYQWVYPIEIWYCWDFKSWAHFYHHTIYKYSQWRYVK